MANGTSIVGPLLQATRTVPIMFPAVGDTVGAGFVDSCVPAPECLPVKDLTGVPDGRSVLLSEQHACERVRQDFAEVQPPPDNAGLVHHP